MEINMYINNYKNLRYNYFKWRYELNIVNKLILASFFACLTGLLAQLRFYLPGTPVPVTGQVFGVILAGVNADLSPIIAGGLEFNNAINEGKEGVVFPHAYVIAGMNMSASLAYQNGSGVHTLSGKSLYSEPL
jgi:hypothetical protein